MLLLGNLFFLLIVAHFKMPFLYVETYASHKLEGVFFFAFFFGGGGGGGWGVGVGFFGDVMITIPKY